MSPAKSTHKPSAKSGKDVIYIDVDDEITAVIDKIEAAKNKVVALVLPKRTPVLQSVVNMRLLKRAADEANKNVVLITSEAALLPLAGAAGIHVAKNLQSAPSVPPPPKPAQTESAAQPEPVDTPAEEDQAPSKIDYNRPVGELASVAEEAEAIDLDDEAEDGAEAKAAEEAAKPKKQKGLKVPDFNRFRLRLALGLLAVAVIAVFLVFALIILPRATIAIQTASEPISASINLTADTKAKKLDLKDGLIPATLQKSDLTSNQTVTATGQKNLGDKATGSATMSTCVSNPGQLNDIPAGTGISTNGLTYITQQSGSFNFAGSCNGGSDFRFESNDVDIVAQEAGSKYNTSISGATIAGYSGVTADGSASGGTDKVVTVLSQADINGAKDKISDADQEEFANDFKDKLSADNHYVLSSTLKAGDPVVTSSAKAGDKVDNAEVTVKITYTALVLNKADLKKALEDKLNSQIDKSRQKIGTDDVVKDASISVQNQVSSNQADLQITEDTTAVPLIDVNEVKSKVKGLKTGGIRDAIEQWPGVKKVDVKLSPFWVSKAPNNTGKITVNITQVKASQPGGN